MKKSTLTLLLIFIISFSYSKDKDKVVLKNDTVYVNKKPSFILEVIDNGVDRLYYLKNLSGKKLVFFKSNYFYDPLNLNPNPYSPPNSNTFYLEVNFLESKQKTEINYYRPIVLAEYIVKSNLVSDSGEITIESENEFILHNGNRYTDRKNELNKK